MKINKYSKNEDYSYCLGAFPTFELIYKRPDLVVEVFIHEDFYEKDKLMDECRRRGLKASISSRQVNRLASKGNTLVVGVFNKFKEAVEDGNHLVLHEISDMGNLGTIIRTMNAFDMRDLVLVGNVCDVFNPRTVRASMGSIFDMRIRHFETMEDYLEAYPNRRVYLFMLSNKEEDSIYHVEKSHGKCSLVFGNEGAGLPDDFSKYGRVVFIPQSERVDSINLPIAASIGIYEFKRARS